jgi:trans-aconitate 2-methyltransferase
MWDPVQYGAFASERARPFFDLVARIGAVNPHVVADLGCGPGNLTAALAARWPGAQVFGLDSSAEMVESAQRMLAGMERQEAAAQAAGRLRFALGDVRDWQPDEPADVIVSNAVLQWVPRHQELLTRWVGLVAAGGWLAFQVPGNFAQPSHRLLRQLARSPRWRDQLSGVQLNRQAADPQDCVDLLARAGCAVDAWETTYLHMLHGDNPVLDWYKGTGLRPVLSALGQADTAEFLSEYGAALREAYPAAPYGTVFPFRRVFAVARKL